MNFNLDVKTALFTIVVGQIFTIILITAYRHGEKRDRAVNTFYLAKWLQTIGWGIAMFKGTLPPMVTVSLSNSALFIGAALEAIALMRAIGAYHIKIGQLYKIMTTGSILIFHVVMIVANSEENRIIIASINTALLLLIPGYRMLISQKSSMLMKVIGSLYFIIAAGALIRAAMVWSTEETWSLYDPSMYQVLSFLSLYLLMFLGNLGFVLLSKEKKDQELLHIASYDDLTGIWNRRAFIKAAESSIHACYERGVPVSLLLMDVDHYKSINDTYGHDVGDGVLQAYCKQVKQVIRKGDLFGRYGGDEFAVLLPNTDENQANEIAEFIRTSMKQTCVDIAKPITLSIGVTTSSADEGILLKGLMKQSDIALYKAKQNGRNQAVYYMK